MLVRNYVRDANSWISGDVDTAAEASNLQNVRAAKLFPYNTSVDIYRCPGERPRSISGVPNVTVVRSFSMNGQMNGDRPEINGPTCRVNRKLGDIRNPGPVDQYVVVDESPTTIDDGYFAIELFVNQWRNVPATRHGRGGTLSFADGHAAFWKWRVASTATATRNLGVTLPNADLQRFRDATGSR
jgi:prepilin-type processing-associated H-X9-DG protein